ncbi:hypothetical protein OG819_41290 [Streptomyces sp. NBC_01549]|nr:hypothetical protein [Streptomyces sp. NBC_01549]MCX4595865.1 hypothetical protein [Streptomyces sp. NBC_01549]
MAEAQQRLDITGFPFVSSPTTAPDAATSCTTATTATTADLDLITPAE